MEEIKKKIFNYGIEKFEVLSNVEKHKLVQFFALEIIKDKK